MKPAYTIEIRADSCHLKCGTLILKATCDLNSIFRTIYQEDAIHLQIEGKIKGATTVPLEWTTLEIGETTIDPMRLGDFVLKAKDLNDFLNKCQKRWPKVEKQIWQENAKLSSSL